MSDNFANNANMVSIMTATGLKIKERAKVFYGTATEWNALTVDQKKEYDYWASPETSEGNAVPEGGTTGQVLTKASNDDFDMAWQGLGTAAGKDYVDTVRAGSHDLVESNAVYSAINNAMSSVYTPRGDLTCAELTSSLLVAANVGNVYTMTDSGTTSALFINGAGHDISVNDNVGIIKAGQNDIMFNLMGNAFDLHDYQKQELDTPLTIGGVSRTTVESALGALNTPHEVIVATAVHTSTKTFKQALYELLTAYNNLTDEQRINSYIRYANAKYTFISGTVNSGTYSHIHVQGGDLLVARTHMISYNTATGTNTSSYTEAQLRSSGVSFPNYSDAIPTSDMRLCYSY